MPKGLRRYYERGDLHFLTFSCYRRLPLLGSSEARNVFVEALSAIRARYQFLLVGYAVMPNHVHLLISESPQATPSIVLKVLKQRVSRDIRGVEERFRHVETTETPHAKAACGAPEERIETPHVEPTCGVLLKDGEGLARFWQPRFYDFNVWSKEKVGEKLDYMHANPVTRKLVDHPKDWAWSSWGFYAKGEAGLVPIDRVG